MFGEEMANHAANKALRKLGIEQKTTKTYIVPEATYSFVDGIVDITIATLLREGDNATIVIDGVAYTETVKRTLLDEETAFYIGNMTPFGVDSGADKPYLVLQDSNSALSVGIIAEAGSAETTTHTIGIYTGEETTTPISDKYLPGVCLPVVELSTELTEGEVALSSDDGKALDKVVGMPCVLAVRFNGVAYRSVFSFLDDGSDIAFSGAPYDANIIVSRSKDGGNWMAIVTPALA